MNRKGYIDGSGCGQWHCSSTCLEELRNTSKDLRQDSRSAGLYPNQGPLEAEVITIRPRRWSKKVKQSRYTPWGASEVRRYSSYSFTTSALDRGEWSASRPGRSLPPGKGPPGTHCTGGWMGGPRAGLDTEVTGKILCGVGVLHENKPWMWAARGSHQLSVGMSVRPSVCLRVCPSALPPSHLPIVDAK
jgi:hypothetical protein